MKRPFHVVVGIHSSALIRESDVGVRSSRTRQYSGKAGPAGAAAGAPPRPVCAGGGDTTSTEEIATLGIAIDRRLSHVPPDAADADAASTIDPRLPSRAPSFTFIRRALQRDRRRVIMDRADAESTRPPRYTSPVDSHCFMTLLQGFLLIVLVVAAGWLLPRLRRVAGIGAAYKARVVCSLVFGGGREADPSILDEVSADSYRLLRLFRCRVIPESRAVTASLWGFRPRTVFFRADGDEVSAIAPWPSAAASPAVDQIVASAFLEPDRRRLRRTRAIVVVQDGQIVAERYAPGFGETTRFSGWSMTKSVLSALVGVLVGEGRLSLRDAELMPAWRRPDPRAAIALEDLLRMRSGLRFSEDYANLTSDVIEMLFNQDDAAAYAASRPLIAPPGTEWSYSSGTTNILSAIVRRTVGEKDYPSWPRRALFAPLRMTSALMEPDASGTFVASSFMLATARDWARFGQLYLQDGVWNGQRLLPEGWVSFSTTPTPESPDGIYGAHWWLGLKPELGGGTPAAARLPRDAFFAVGHEAQVLTVIPSRRLVVVRLGLSISIDAWNHAAFLSELLEVL